MAPPGQAGGAVQVPVVTVDGPSGSGKGTLCRLLALRCGWRYLDSGSLYRLLALRALRDGLDKNADFVEVVQNMDFHCQLNGEQEEAAFLLDGVDVTSEIRSESVAAMASKLARLPRVRQALLQRQRDMRRPPGLVADGRDMGTVVFPDADLKIFLQADASARARRRYKQLGGNPEGDSAGQELQGIYESIQERDQRDQARAESPLQPAADAVMIDSTDMSIEDVYLRTLALGGKLFPKSSQSEALTQS